MPSAHANSLSATSLKFRQIFRLGAGRLVCDTARKFFEGYLLVVAGEWTAPHHSGTAEKEQAQHPGPIPDNSKSNCLEYISMCAIGVWLAL